MGFSSKPTIKRTQPSNVFGHIPGVPIGSTFENRLFLHHSSVHSGILAGIAGSKHEGCYSVVLSGGYEDDKDDGYSFTYTGCGGRDKKSGEKPREGPQTCDQSWSNSRNMSLKVSAYTKKPVRVVRGYKSSSDFAPAKGYRYDGLYVVEKAWMDVGKSGFKVCKFLLKRLPNQPPIPRRQGTLHLDLSEWERPRHFGRDASADTDTDSESDPESDSDPESEDERRASLRKGPRRRAIPMATPRVPLIRRPRDRYSNELSSRRRSASPPPRKQRQPSPIPPTTNIRAAERRVGAQPPSVPPQASAQAPQPDVHAIIAEWKRPGVSIQARSGPAQKEAQAVERPCPTRPMASGRPAAPGQARGHPAPTFARPA
ncbi:PUA-like domain-containing protein [Cubamyces lactineus]|nr:PUA-like domain-containing protein [Cubamyces lactineus]